MVDSETKTDLGISNILLCIIVIVCCYCTLSFLYCTFI